MTNQNELMQKGNALLIVDVQRDFCPGGALTIENADRILPVLKHWIQQTHHKGRPIYASHDWHPEGRRALSQIKPAGVKIVSTAVEDPEIDVCQKAPEWTEHARFEDSDEPCDGGRSGKIYG